MQRATNCALVIEASGLARERFRPDALLNNHASPSTGPKARRPYNFGRTFCARRLSFLLRSGSPWSFVGRLRGGDAASAPCPPQKDFNFRFCRRMTLPQIVYLFQYGETDRYALSTDVTGCIPRPDSQDVWLLRSPIIDADALDLQEALKVVAMRGYCILFVREDD